MFFYAFGSRQGGRADSTEVQFICLRKCEAPHNLMQQVKQKEQREQEAHWVCAMEQADSREGRQHSNEVRHPAVKLSSDTMEASEASTTPMAQRSAAGANRSENLKLPQIHDP